KNHNHDVKNSKPKLNFNPLFLNYKKMNIKKASWFRCIYSVYSPPLLNCLLRVQLACIAVRPNRETKENSERESTQKHKRDKTLFPNFIPCIFLSSHFLSIWVSLFLLRSSSVLHNFCFFWVILLCGSRFFCIKIRFLLVGKWKANYFSSGFWFLMRLLLVCL
ncbi:unnamed protein product, partial [Vicia faba]